MPSAVSRKNSPKPATADRLDGIFSRPLVGPEDDGGADIGPVAAQLARRLQEGRPGPGKGAGNVAGTEAISSPARAPRLSHQGIFPRQQRLTCIEIPVSVARARMDRQRNHIADELENYSNLYSLCYGNSNFDDLS